MKFDIVVAHYRENLSWLDQLKHDDINNIFVYTKSDMEPKFDNEKIKHYYLTNVGRESHTYIWHCVNFWKDIASGHSSEFVFFVQGSPHGLDCAKIINWIELVNKDNLEFTYNFRTSSIYEFLNNGRCSDWAGKTNPAAGDVKDWCAKHVKNDPESLIPVFWNACFGVSRDSIARSTRQRYVNIMQNELNDINPECGHYCERLWHYIFNMEKCKSKPKDCYDFWGGFDGKKHYGSMKLNDDGTIGMYNHFNEKFWEKSGDSIIIYNENKNPTCVLKKTKENEYQGEFANSGQKSIHRLTRI